MAEPPTKKQRRRLNFDKCQFCRNAKKACTPADRTWPQKCNRCIDLGLDCAENSRLQGAPPLIPRQPDRQTIGTSDTQKLNDLSLRVTCLRRLKFYHRVAMSTLDKYIELPVMYMYLAQHELCQITGFIEGEESSLRTDILDQSIVPHIQLATFMALSLDTEPTSFQHPPKHPSPQLFPSALPESFAEGCDLGTMLAMTETLWLPRQKGLNKEISSVELQQYCDTYLKMTQQLKEIIGPKVPALPPLHYILSLTRGNVIFRLTSSQTHFLAMQDYLGRPLLHLAFDLGIMEDVMRFVEFDVATPIQDIGGRCPIFIACSGNSEAVVEYFLRNRVDLSIVDADPRDISRRLYSAAAIGGHTAIIKLLLEKGADIDLSHRYSGTPLCIAAENGHVAVVKLLLKRGARIDLGDKFGDTPLYVAAKNGHAAVVKLLLKKGARINLGDKYGNTPLYIAAKNGQAAIVELLLKKGASIYLGHRQYAMLYIAAENGHAAVVELLLKQDARIDLSDEYGNALLYIAVENGHAAVVELLLKQDARIDLGDEYSNTLLYIAAKNGHAVVVKLLLKQGASINLGDKYGDTPLYIAAGNGHTAVVKLLLKKGASINLINNYGSTSLHAAAENGHAAVVKLLLKQGASIYLKNTHGDTPLYVAANHGYAPVIKLLLGHGAEPNSVGWGGKTPWEVATEGGHTEVAELLTSAMSGRTATRHTTHTDSDSESDSLSSSDDD
ncbi:putative ankyrin repeat domain-containing protein 29-like [Rosellinia necatrix]|uniref:Putative ankyrin repeat domain-containing protein 29-like n=1 Tax=Rosellinia necatrix TaxID=77044 RepID=A0A1S7UJ78_ROSNE|nr:putative ankyrin repeat domain-containing protein 29-like [Rosellinia necatrix]